MSGIILFNNQTVDGDSSIFKVESGGTAHIRMFGTFGGGTITIQIAYNDANFVDLQDGAFTEADVTDVLLKVGETLKLNLSGSTGADISADLLN